MYKFLISILMLFNTLPASLIMPSEVEIELQSNEATTADRMMKEFVEKGGKFVRQDDEAAPFKILAGDVVFPSCSGGNNRSQTLWKVLKPFGNKIVLMKPHGTQYSLDPYKGKINWERTKYPPSETFTAWAGFPKSTKLGWDVFEAEITKNIGTKESRKDNITDQIVTAEEFKFYTDYYNENYYAFKVDLKVRRVYITFDKNAHTHLYRLNKTHDSLENVVIVFFPLKDWVNTPPPQWNTEPHSLKAYIEFEKLILRGLDLEGL